MIILIKHQTQSVQKTVRTDIIKNQHKKLTLYSGTPLKRTPLGPTIVSAIARVSLAQGLVVDNAPPIIVIKHDSGQRKRMY